MRSEEELGYGKRLDLDPFEVEPGAGAEWVGKEGSMGSDEEAVVKVLSKNKGKSRIGADNDKTVVGLKNHSEAERRRRERINGNLDGFLCFNGKMDKASLLAEVINQVKELQEQARHVSKGLLIPLDADELLVEPLENQPENGVINFKATLCCDYRPDIFSDLKKGTRSLNVKTLHTEISTLRGRVKTLFIISSRNKNTTENLSKAIHQALSSVINRPSALPEYSPRTNLSNKRFKYSSFESSSS